MIDLTKILIKRPSCGYYIRWYYNGFHYWNFLPGPENLLTEGEKYNTTGKTKISLYSGQVNDSQINGLWPLMKARDVAIYTLTGWKTLLIDPGSAVVHRNQINGYEIEVNATIGSLQVPLVIPEPPVIYVTPPAFYSAEVGLIASDMLVIRFDRVLQIVTPATGDFTPTFSGGAVTVTNVAITDIGGYYYVYLTLSRVIVYGETGTIQYTPGVNKLIGAAPYNANVYEFTENVINNVADLVAPVFVSAEYYFEDEKLVILVDKDLDDNSVPDTTDFVIIATGGAVIMTTVNIINMGLGLRHVTSNLDRVIACGEIVSVEYTPGSNPLRSSSGIDMLTFNESVYNRAC